ncbi:hypothetical protein [Glycomyces xiaoerkulensis]|uniref:hypothetical protein n=1 Tax=Glycomyces xiaoerkulensis TaxID=2038139 RepID=UPI000C26147C|nr:hypothetical protein [Glycomyces xiaoerkulensis]
MSEGIRVDPDQLDQAASAIRDTADNADDLASYAKDSDPDVWAWGLPATFLAAPFYIGLVDMLHQQFSGVRQTIEGFADMVEECGADARENDDGTAEVFLDLEGELEGEYSDE